MTLPIVEKKIEFSSIKRKKVDDMSLLIREEENCLVGKRENEGKRLIILKNGN